MKRILFFLSLLVVMTQGVYATHIVKAPGSMTDVFTELPIQDISNADTIFVDGGTGDIYLKAGPTDDGIAYSWAVGVNNYYTYTVTFTFADADVTLPDGSQSALVSVIRSNPDQVQYFYVVYRYLPLKPSTPSGFTSVCTGTSTNYSSTGANATSYQWYISNPAAGTLSNATTSTVTVNWTAGWTGDVELTVKGIKDATQSPLSDPLEVTVGTVPTKPTITGDPFVKKSSSIIYTGNSAAAATWTWTMTPNTLATATPSGQNVTIDFTATGTFSLTTQSHNTCGDSEVSDGFNVEIVDIGDLEAEIIQLNADKLALQNQVDALVADTTSKGIASRNTIAALKADKLALQNSLATVTQERNDALAANVTLTATNTQLAADKLALQNTLATVTQERDDALAANVTLTATNTQLAADKLALQNALATVTQERDDALAANAPLIQQVTDLTAANILVNGLLDDSEATVAQLTADKLALQNALATAISERDQAIIDRDAALAANAPLLVQIEDLEDDIVTLEAQIVTLEAQIVTLEAQIVTLEAQITTLSQVYILSWEVTEVVTSVFETEIGNFSVSLYPNPSPGQVFIECTEEIKEVKIFSLQGTLIKQFTVNNTETSFVVARSEMPVGTYIVHIQTTKGTSTHKIIFQ